LRSTIFTEMTALAVRTGAVNLGQGFPDTDGPAGMLEVARSAIASGHNQYPPGSGIPELRNAVAEQRAACYGLLHDADTEVLITVGATEAISAALLALVGHGDEVLLIEPYYDSYPAAVALAGATRRCVPLVSDGDRFALDLDAVRRAITPATKALLLNSPHNPTGTVLRRAELAALAALAVEHDLLVVTDEVYEHLAFDGAPHLPIAAFPGMAQRTLSVSSAGKTFSVTGWKIGWVCGPAHLVAAVQAVKQFLTFVAGAPLQPAVAHALTSGRWATATESSSAAIYRPAPVWWRYPCRYSSMTRRRGGIWCASRSANATRYSTKRLLGYNLTGNDYRITFISHTV
jgi:N-succinyldiaminopimelate aminotransferase